MVGQPLVLTGEAAAAEEEEISSASTDGVFPVLETPPYLARKLPQAWLDKVGQGGGWGGGRRGSYADWLSFEAACVAWHDG